MNYFSRTSPFCNTLEMVFSSSKMYSYNWGYWGFICQPHTIHLNSAVNECFGVISSLSTRCPWSIHQLWPHATWTWRTWSQTRTAASPRWPSPLCWRRAARAAWTGSWSRSPHSSRKSQTSSRSVGFVSILVCAFCEKCSFTQNLFFCLE